MRHLKKYPNRRLYDTSTSQYITVEDVRRLIVKGESITVTDSKDGSDLTRSILLQILSEQEAEGHEPVLTNRAIEQLIRFYGDRLGGMVSRYIEQSILMFIDHQDQFRQRMRALNELNPFNLVRQAFGDKKDRDPTPQPNPDLEFADAGMDGNSDADSGERLAPDKVEKPVKKRRKKSATTKIKQAEAPAPEGLNENLD